MRQPSATLLDGPGQHHAHLLRLGVALTSQLSQVARVRVEGCPQAEGEDAGPHASRDPALVVWPGDVEDLARGVAFGVQHGLGMAVRTAMPCRAGRGLPPRARLRFDFSEFGAIDDLDMEQGMLWVRAGTSWGAIVDFLDPLGLALATVPSSRFSTVVGGEGCGGMGAQSMRHGHVSDWIEALDVVSPSRGREVIRRDDPHFPILLGATGRPALVARVCLRVLLHPPRPRPHLLGLESAYDALALADSVLALDSLPLHMKVMLADVDEGDTRAGSLAAMRHFVLVVTDEPGEAEFQALLASSPCGSEAQARFSQGAWRDCYDPLHTHAREATAISATVVLPCAAMAEYARRALALGRRLSLRVPIEGTYVRVGDRTLVVAAATFKANGATATGCGAAQGVRAALHQLAASLGGMPCGTGLGALPVALGGHAPDRWDEASARFDPQGLLCSEEALAMPDTTAGCLACGRSCQEPSLAVRVTPDWLARSMLRGDAIPWKSGPEQCPSCLDSMEMAFARRSVLAVLDEPA